MKLLHMPIRPRTLPLEALSLDERKVPAEWHPYTSPLATRFA
jgi:hypothetical protein